jgi:hypothetical protein
MDYHINMKNYFTFLEAKEAIIKKAPWSDEEKKQIQELVDKYPQKASKIDWNKIKDLAAKDVLAALQEASKKDVKKGKIAGITSGKDYIDISTDKYEAYIPLTWEASRILAHESVGGCTGQWCTAYQKNQRYWTQYVFQEDKILVYVMSNKFKFAVVFPGSQPHSTLQIWTAQNDHVSASVMKNHINVDVQDLKKTFDFKEIRKKIEDHPTNKWYYSKSEFGKFLFEQIKVWKDTGDDTTINFFEMLNEFYFYGSMTLTELNIDFDDLIEWIGRLELHGAYMKASYDFEELHDAIHKKTVESLSSEDEKDKDMVFDVFLEDVHKVVAKMITLDKLDKIDNFLSRALDFDGFVFINGIWKIIYVDDKRLKRFCEVIANKKYNHTIIREYFNQGGD